MTRDDAGMRQGQDSNVPHGRSLRPFLRRAPASGQLLAASTFASARRIER